MTASIVSMTSIGKKESEQAKGQVQIEFLPGLFSAL